MRQLTQFYRTVALCAFTVAFLSVQEASAAIITFTSELDSASDYDSPFTVLPNSIVGAEGDLDGSVGSVVRVNTDIPSAGRAYYSFMSSAVYTPSVSGAIDSIDWSTDIRKSGSPYNTPLFLALTQGGTLYMYKGEEIIGGSTNTAFRPNSTTWETVSLTGAGVTDFLSYDLTQTPFSDPKVNAGDTPDFTSSGAAITFGYIGFAATSGSNLHRETEITNSSITVVPEPSALSLMVMALLGVALVRNRKR
ncbi:PEP-CTERM sorting domain-containing protein [Kiritimatiellota bacterium B12222]|nr:PEP-CTERM sorting domain-containing protein [Kiritimatiellota bacterium B12222]